MNDLSCRSLVTCQNELIAKTTGASTFVGALGDTSTILFREWDLCASEEVDSVSLRIYALGSGTVSIAGNFSREGIQTYVPGVGTFTLTSTTDTILLAKTFSSVVMSKIL